MMDIKGREDEILGYWEERRPSIVVRERNAKSKKFYFLDGPPYATGDLAGHHIWVGSAKDVILRYKRYRGFYVHDRAGFDVHGLPIENKVEKILNIKNKGDIERVIGIERFVGECRRYADDQIGVAVKILKSFGSSLDFDNMYIPYTSGYIERGWGILKEIHNKKLLYKGTKILAYCPHCETVLSAQGPEIDYEDVDDRSVFVKYRVVNEKDSNRGWLRENTYLIIWTTTPWTLVSNIAIAANPDVVYITLKRGNERYIVAKDRADEIASYIGDSVVIEAEFYGSEMEGLRYESVMESKVPRQKGLARYHRVIMGREFVNVVEGSGLLHVAPAHGPEDFKLGMDNKLPVFSPVDSHARYTEEAGEYAYLSVPDEANKRIIADLEKMGSLVHIKGIRHSYPHCWRCSNKLIYKVTDQWFINVQKLKRKMLKENEGVVWHPPKAKDWMRETLESSPDWCISRQRYWGTPIPIWECRECKSIEAIGSIEELRSRATDRTLSLADLHRPYIDRVVIKCGKCGGESRRIEDIFDVWYDSGIAHTASLSDEELDRLYPADWISEGRDQLRGWFSALLRTGVALYNKSPFKDATIGGIIFDEMGREMHRHLGNSVYAKDIREMVSSDGFRVWCMSRPRWQDLKLKKKELIEGNNNIVMLYNISELLREIASMADFDIRSFKRPAYKRLCVEDRWILSRLNSLISVTTEELDRYNIDVAINKMLYFIVEELSRTYLKFLKKRSEAATKRDMRDMANLFSYILYNTILLFSIYAPFSTEYIYRSMFSVSGESLFEGAWPKPAKRMIDTELEADFEVMKSMCSSILNLREKEGVKLRQPIGSAKIEVNEDSVYRAVAELSELICSYTNTKRIDVVKTDAAMVEIKPLFAKLGPDFKQNAKVVAEGLADADPKIVKTDIETNGYYILHTDSGTFEIRGEHISIVERAGRDDQYISKYGIVYIDTNVTEELREETITREFIRGVQNERKLAGLTRTDIVDIYIEAFGPALDILSRNTDMIKRVIKARKINYSKPRDAVDGEKELEVYDTKVRIWIVRL